MAKVDFKQSLERCQTCVLRNVVDPSGASALYSPEFADDLVIWKQRRLWVNVQH